MILKKNKSETSVAVQWLGLYFFTAKDQVQY